MATDSRWTASDRSDAFEKIGTWSPWSGFRSNFAGIKGIKVRIRIITSLDFNFDKLI